MATIIPFILIVAALTIIIVLLVRKYPQLTLLDVDNIEEVQLEKKKDEYWKKRADKKAEESKIQLSKSLVPVLQKMKDVQSTFRTYVGNIEKRLVAQAKQTQEKVVDDSEKGREKLRKILQDAALAFENEAFEDAEKKFIRAVSMDNKNVAAYRGLAATYQKLGQKDEARETFAFLVQLDPKDEATLMKYADLLEEDGDVVGAVRQYRKIVKQNSSNPVRLAKLAQLLQKAQKPEEALEVIQEVVEREPDNPKYLDNLIEISIMVGNTDLATEGWEQLRKVNPDNQKLASLKEAIERARS